MKGIKFSIRWKVLLLITAVLLATMGIYLYLATSLFKQDKLSYVYDLNGLLVETLSQQTRAELDTLVRTMAPVAVAAAQASGDAARLEQVVTEAIAADGSLLRVEVLETDPETGKFVTTRDLRNQRGLDALGFGDAELALLREESPLPLEGIAASEAAYLQNSSLPPDAPVLTLALNASSGGVQRVLAVDFEHQRLLRLFRKSKLHKTYLVDERGVVIAHPDPEMVLRHQVLADDPLVGAALEGGAEHAVTEFTGLDGEVKLGAYAPVGFGRLRVFTELPKAQALRASEELTRRSLLFGIAIVLAALMISIFFSRYLTNGIRRLGLATKRVATGNFDVDLEVKSRDEIGELATDFAEMVRRLKDAQAQLVQSEKLAAFGQLGAGITHEVKNPMTGIVGFAQVAQRKMDKPEKVLELLKLIETESLRCKDILVNFLKFARAESGTMAVLDPNTVVQDAIKIFGHQLHMGRVLLDSDLAEGLPPIRGTSGELQQVLLNLAMNARDAMPEGGKVKVATRAAGDHVEIVFSDSGPGIPEAVRQRIFEPFFTTKEAGKGTGLGLSVSFGIIRNHQGTISVSSEPGRGTTFVIRLPAASPEEQSISPQLREQLEARGGRR